MHIYVGTIIAGKYQLERPLARGGMGSVWVARHVKLGARLAVKFLEPRFASMPGFIGRFEREARAAAALRNNHVVHVQDFGVEDDTPYLVMELLQGEDLESRLRRVHRLSLQDAAHILVQVGKALRKAHKVGIVHRDLKPANLFLAETDDEEVVKVLDFGIAKETAGPVGPETETGDVMGSPRYMSPEQARADKSLDHRTDIWALGVILYRAVTGTFPFDGDALAAILSQILVDPAPPVATVAPDLPPSLDPFFARALAKAKENRFQSVRELIETFVQIAGGTGRKTLPSLSSFTTSTPDVDDPQAPDLAQNGPEPQLPRPLPVAAVPDADLPTILSKGAPSDREPTVPLPSREPSPAASAASGNSTLTSASTVREQAARGGARPGRAAAFIIGGVALSLVIGAAAVGISLFRGTTSNAAAIPISAFAPEPAASSAAAAPTVELAATWTGAQSYSNDTAPSSAQPTPPPPGAASPPPAASPPGSAAGPASSASASPAKGAAPARRPTGGRPGKKSGNGWGF